MSPSVQKLGIRVTPASGGGRSVDLMDSITAAAVQMMGASRTQQIGIAAARHQVAADKAVAGLVAESAAGAGPPAPPGQGQSLDLRV